jgi:hypothetical protein
VLSALSKPDKHWEGSLRKRISAIAFSMMFLSQPAWAECRVGAFHFFAGSETETNMTVSSGRRCGLIVYAAGRSRFDNLGIAQRPEHGALSSRSGVGFDYTSAAAYKGDDVFIVTVTGAMRTGTGTARIKVHVTVL